MRGRHHALSGWQACSRASRRCLVRAASIQGQLFDQGIWHASRIFGGMTFALAIEASFFFLRCHAAAPGSVSNVTEVGFGRRPRGGLRVPDSDGSEEPRANPSKKELFYRRHEKGARWPHGAPTVGPRVQPQDAPTLMAWSTRARWTFSSGVRRATDGSRGLPCLRRPGHGHAGRVLARHETAELRRRRTHLPRRRGFRSLYLIESGVVASWSARAPRPGHRPPAPRGHLREMGLLTDEPPLGDHPAQRCRRKSWNSPDVLHGDHP